MSIDLNQALEYAVAWAKELERYSFPISGEMIWVYKPNRMCTMW